MAELKCPHCGQAFTVDDAELGSIISQIRDSEFARDVNERVDELTEHMKEKHMLQMQSRENELKLKIKEDYEKELAKLSERLKEAEDKAGKYKSDIDRMEDKNEIAVMKAVKIVEDKNRDLERQLIEQKEKEEFLLKQKDEQIAYYKDLKTKMSTKMVGETLEQHCETLFNQLRATAFTLAWKIPWMEEPGRLQSMGSLRVGHD